jgi:CspA family cold shock protein
MITASVKFFNTDKSYGFIAPERSGDEAFVHIGTVERAGMNRLEEDQRGKMSVVNLQLA